MDMSVMAARAATRDATRSIGSPATDLRARITPATRLRDGKIRKGRARKSSPVQRDSTGNRSAWAESPYYWTDPAWSRTVSDRSAR